MKVKPITTIKTVVETIEQGGTDIKVFSLVDPDRWELPPFRPGAHIDLHLPGGMVRTYSLCNDPADNKRYLVAVKRERGGRGGSVKLHDEIKVGDTIGVTLPRGGLKLDGDLTHHVFVAGGIGVTPFLSAAAFLQRSGRPDFRLHLMVRGEPPLKAMLAPLMKTGHVVVHDTTRSGRPDVASLVGLPSPGVSVACCGPESMLDDFEQATRDWPGQRVHIERFVPPALPVDRNARPYTLALSRSKLEMRVDPGQTMLAALVSLGIDIPASCCGGICGSCKVDWLEGAPVHRDRVLSPAERARSLMVCVAGSAEDRLVLDL
ncbi:PDR/VanB family oxidoreductase [Bradyrhizobium sp.]|jgi:vanillate O-demethylase ferredoxin subunit|uniref:PDR/VanB family oxidoreductase n=1 Tax=Bradyrhizobium sp. TaxID=376 RepID=UPI003D0A7C25